MVAIWDAYDTDLNSLVSYEEFGAYVKNTLPLHHPLVAGEDGCLNFTDFSLTTQGLEATNFLMSDEHIEWAFEFADKNRSAALFLCGADRKRPSFALIFISTPLPPTAFEFGY